MFRVKVNIKKKEKVLINPSNRRNFNNNNKNNRCVRVIKTCVASI